MKYDLFAMARTASVRGEIKFAPLPKDVQAEIDEWARKYAPKSIPIENTEEEMKALEASEKARKSGLWSGKPQEGSEWITRGGWKVVYRQGSFDHGEKYNGVWGHYEEDATSTNAFKGHIALGDHVPIAITGGSPINARQFDIIGPWTE